MKFLRSVLASLAFVVALASCSPMTTCPTYLKNDSDINPSEKDRLEQVHKNDRHA